MTDDQMSDEFLDIDAEPDAEVIREYERYVKAVCASSPATWPDGTSMHYLDQISPVVDSSLYLERLSSLPKEQATAENVRRLFVEVARELGYEPDELGAER